MGGAKLINGASNRRIKAKNIYPSPKSLGFTTQNFVFLCQTIALEKLFSLGSRNIVGLLRLALEVAKRPPGLTQLRFQNICGTKINFPVEKFNVARSGKRTR